MAPLATPVDVAPRWPGAKSACGHSIVRQWAQPAGAAVSSPLGATVALDSAPGQGGSIRSLDGGAPKELERAHPGGVQRGFSLSSQACRILNVRSPVSLVSKEVIP